LKNGLTIGNVAAQVRVNVQTLRYYERRGLVIPHARRDSGYRLYAPDAILRMRFIKNAQLLGFTLDEISILLRLRVKHRSQCSEVKAKAERKLKSVHEKISALRALEKSLKVLIRACNDRTVTDPCPLLESLEKNGKKQFHGG
jgi:MerR family transcriptional regulator, copper efflux regulator